MIHTHDPIHPLFRNILQPYLPDLQPMDPPLQDSAAAYAEELRASVESDRAKFADIIHMLDTGQSAPIIDYLFSVFTDPQPGDEMLRGLLEARVSEWIGDRM